MLMDRDKLQLSKEEMKAYGYSIVDAVVEHFETQDKKLPLASATREEMDSLFLEEAPEQSSDPQEVLDFVIEKVMKKSAIVSHPKFYSFVPGPSNYISAMSDTLATGFNVFSGGWAQSPPAAELEIVTISWLLKIFGLPVKKGGGIFTSGGSMANLTAIVTARRVMCGENFANAVIYLSDQAHSSNIKALRIIGFTREQIRLIPTDSEFKFSTIKLKSAISRDRLEGYNPFCVIATAGTTNTGTVDPLEAISKICKEEKLWFHIDGAYGGAAILAKNGKQLLKGVSKADSLTVDPHKWFFQPYEMGCLLIRNHKYLKSTFVEKPEYLRDIEGNESEINFYDHGVQLTRRFRALKFYMSLKTFGLKAFRNAITYNIVIAEKTEKLLRKSKKWEVVSPATLAIINFRYNPIGENFSEKELDNLNQKISGKVTASGEAQLVTTILNKQVVLRMCLINPRTKFEDVKATLSLCEGFANELLASKGKS
ncbi:pyridoxal phosphate-dependent decarboxylase family protein [Dokdonia sp. Hel_I_53]|uniref:pyridoxal phosphate-dependent decarboxylase family protein n=1 Tax=Dokdonia sp. Hel_I_53 TaxID=1566287 RepID=UPI0039657A05